jgi:hypothetical protein
MRLVEPGNLLIKYAEDGIWRVTGLEFIEEWMGTEIFLCLLPVSFDSVVEYGLIVKGRGCCSGCLGHAAQNFGLLGSVLKKKMDGDENGCTVLMGLIEKHVAG